jgi:hypothetical protein
MSNFIEIKNLTDVKIGDEFAINARSRFGYRLKIASCSHVTPKQAKIGSDTYWKKDARGIGKGFDCPPCLYVVTPELRLEIADLDRRAIIKSIDSKGWDTLSSKTIEAIYRILWPSSSKVERPAHNGTAVGSSPAAATDEG